MVYYSVIYDVLGIVADFNNMHMELSSVIDILVETSGMVIL